jgi:hypothetical protein
MMGNTSDRAGANRGPGDTRHQPPLTPAQLAARYHLGLTKVYEECRAGILKDVCRHWGRRIYIPASAAARIFGEEVE